MVPASPRRRRNVRRVLPLVLATLAAATAHLAGQGPLVPGANVNMVRGTAFIGGDPFLQRQNEPSLAISTRNPCHLLAGANDYRTVDFPDPTPIPNEGAAPAAPVQNPRDAWLGVYTSMDCGATWRSALLPGHPFDTSAVGLASPNRGFTSAADPVVRAGTNGLFFYAGLVFDRADNSRSQIFVSRFIDNNNRERGDTIEYIDASLVDTGDPEVFVDKPWIAVDQPRAGALMCDINGQQFPAGRVYAAWARFEGGGSRIMLARSLDCGRTWQSQALTDTAVSNQGASIAVAPHDGTVYVTWRQFAREGSPATIQIATSRDGGATFTQATVASPINAFDQSKLENRRFRTNSLPTVAADHLGRVYVAWAERGYARASGRTDPMAGDARIVMTVSTNGGSTFSPRYPIDDTVLDADGAPRFGHQVMPSLTFAAGKLQIIYYDFSDDFADVFNEFVDESETPPVDPTNPNVRRRHTVDVRAAHAEPAALPVFVPVIVTPQGTSPRLSNYRTIVDADGTVRQVQFNPPNLPLFVGGTIPFIGDYIDVAGLSFVPFQGAWRHNNSNTSGPRFDGAFPSLPAFHAVWTDHRDVKPPLDGDWTLYKAPGDPFWKMPGSECVPDRAGMRNANIYTARVTNGLYAGSPGNTKPLGFQRTVTGELVRDASGNPVHMQRSFVVFVQNSLQVPKKYLLRIVNQPGAVAGDRASFLRAPAPPFSAADLATRPYIWLVANVPPLSTISRTVFVTSANERAMVRVDVLEVSPTAQAAIGTDPRTAPLPLAGGRRATVLLNPDPTNPTIIDPDFVSPDVPVLAEETHDPEIFDPVVTTIGNVRNNAIELRNPDEANPDEANPDEANIDEETPDEANPDEANPDEANPDEANPDEANPDEANAGLRNTALPDEQLTNAHVVDVQWKVKNNGNTTTSFRFSPTFSGERTGKHFQLLVTKRYYVPAVDGITCELGVRRTNQVMVNMPAFNPRNPDEANPDEANPDEANPDEANPDEANPDEANPDEANATFFLAPGETATATLRVYDLTTAEAPPPAVLATFEETASAVIQSQAVNTGEASPPRDVAGADLVATNAAVSPANAAPGTNAQISWTLANRGTEATEAASFRTRFLFSTDREISEGDTELAVVTFTGTVPPDDPATPAVNEGELPQTTTVTIPSDDAGGPRFILLVTDSLNEVPEADEANNAAAAELVGAQALAFAGQPSNVTQGFRFSTPLTVAVVPVAGVPPTVAFVNLGTASGPSGATLSGTLSAPVVAGLATFTDVTLSLPGTYTLVATGTGIEGLPVFAAPAVSSPFTVLVDAPPVAVPDNYAVAAGGILNISSESESRVTQNDADALRTGPGVAPPGRALLASLVQSAQHGTLTFNAGGGFVYQPTEGFDGVDFFTYRLNDGVAFGNTTTVRIAVGTGEGNAAPVTRPLSITVAEDSSNTPVDVVAAAIDADGDAMSIVGASAVNGTAIQSGGVLRYTPDLNYAGADTIEYVITDGRGGNTAGVVSVTVTPVNDNPIATNDGPFAVPLNSGVTAFDVLANDNDGPDSGETLTVVRVGGASHGSVTFTSTDVRYTPHRDYDGPDSFSYEISDGNGGSASALVTVNVGENTDPDAVDDAFETTEDIAGISYGVLVNDTDPDAGDVLSITAVTQATHGSVDFTPGPGANTVRYIPAPNFNGIDTFTYTVSDGRGGSDTAMVTVTVTSVNDEPVFVEALPDHAVQEGAPDTAIDLSEFVTDVDVETNGEVLNYSVSQNTNAGVVTATIDGTILTLDYGAPGTATVGITVEDEHDGNAVDAFLVNVDDISAPLVVASSGRLAILHDFHSDAPYTGGTAPYILSLIGGTLPRGLSITGGSITGEPQQTGEFEITLRVTDARGRTDDGTLTLEVGAVDQEIDLEETGGSTQVLSSTRRLAQTLTAGADGYLGAVGVFNLVCTSSSATVRVWPVSGSGVAPPDETGTPLAVSAGSPEDFGEVLVFRLASRPFFRANGRFAVVIETTGACEIRNVAATQESYILGHAFESSGGGPWQRISGAPDLPMATAILPVGVQYLTDEFIDDSRVTHLGDGQVLITGMFEADTLNTITGIAQPTTNEMTFGRFTHTATRLDDGRVLIAGGAQFEDDDSRSYPTQAEVYSAGQFQLSGAMNEGREGHTATKLPDGRVVIIGGRRFAGATTTTLASVQIFNPATNTFSSGGALPFGRADHTATLLVCPVSNPECAWAGTILVNGGTRLGGTAALIYDPVALTSTATTGNPVISRGNGHSATLLADGRVLIVGASNTAVAVAEIYDPATGGFAAVAGPSLLARYSHTATRLADGDVLIAGGTLWDQFELGPRTDMFRFDVETSTFAGAGSLHVKRGFYHSTLLPDGRVLLVGGMRNGHIFIGPSSELAGGSVEYYDPNTSAVVITTTSLPNGVRLAEYPTTTLAAAGGIGPYTFQVVSGTLPPGLVFDNGTISGTVSDTASGWYSFTVEVRDASSTPLVGAQTLEIRVTGNLQITTATLPPGSRGVAYSAQLQATGGFPPYRWSLTPGQRLPGNLTLNSDGSVTGVPNAVESFNTRIRVEDAAGQFIWRHVLLTIAGPLQITTAALRDAIASEGYGVGFTSTGGSGSKTWTIDSGILPNGLTLNTSGFFSGAIYEAGDFPITVRATDSQGSTTTKAFPFHVGAFDVQRFRSNPNQTIAVGPQSIAQTLTVGANGDLYGIRADVTCTTGQTFGIRIRGVDAQGRPDGNTFPGLELLNQTPRPSFEVYAFPGRRRYTIGSKLAVEFFGSGGCSIHQSSDLGGGDVFRETGPVIFTPIAATPSSLTMGTVIDPETDFAFGSWFSSDGTATHLTCPAGPGTCGYPEQVLLSANTRALQLYDPATHRTNVTPNFFDRFFSSHTATRLADGRVLIAGGWQRIPPATSSTLSSESFIFDPATRTMSPTGSMHVTRSEHQAVLLHDGRVLVVGGLGVPGANDIRHGILDAEVFNPLTGTWTIIGQTVDTRWEHTLTRLECPEALPGCSWSGRVLIFGGYTDTWPVVNAELFYPLTNTFAVVPGGEENRSRAQHAAAQMLNGQVILTGGQGVGFAGILDSTDTYDPSNGSAGTISRGPSLGGPRMAHTATLVGDGTIVVAGGVTRAAGAPTASIERLHQSGSFIGAGSMGTVRRGHTAVRLLDGSLAFAGGWTSWNRLGAVSLERFDPTGQFAISTTTLPDARLAEPYDGSIDTFGGDFPIEMQIIDGALPPGLALQNNAGAFTIHGIPSAAGLFEFTARANESGGEIAYQRLSIHVRESLMVSQSPVGATVGTLFDEPLSAFGGTGTAWTWAFEPGFGAMPPGITLTTDGRLVGTPAAGGSFSWMVRVTDNATPPQTVVRRIRLNVSLADREQLQVHPEFGLAHVSAFNNLRIAQTVIAGRSGRLTSVRLRAYCTTGHLTVSIYDTTDTAPYVPTSQLAVEGIGQDLPAPAAWREIAITTPVFLRAGEAYAIAVNSFNGECNVELGSGVTYSGGSLYVSSWTAPDNWNPYGASPGDFAFASYVDPVEISAFGSPTVDGRHDADEWSNASRVNVTMLASDGERVPATVFFQNDLQNLYMSVTYDRPRFDPYTATDLYFDEDDDRDSFEAGEDILTFNSAPTGFPWFGDNHQSNAICAPNTCWEQDVLRGGTSDGMTRQTYAGETFTVEMQHPIDGGDRFDLSAVLGQTLGIRINHLIWEPNDLRFVQFPQWSESPAPWTLAAPADTCVLVPPGLVSWWRGEETVGELQDAHGNNDALVFGIVEQATGRFGSAFSFTGGGRLETADSPTLSPHLFAGDELTLEAWVNVATLPAGSRTIIGKVTSATTREYALSMQGSTVRFDLWQAGASPQLHASVSGGTITTDTWHHLVGTFRNGRSVRLYVDGVLVAESTSLTGAVGDSSAPLSIGGSPVESPGFVGLIDEPAVYRREMTPDQVRSLHANGKCRTPSQRYSLQVIKIGHGTVTASSGIINCGADCVDSYPSGANATLSAIPHAFGGVTFTGFTGDCPGGVCTMTRDMTVFATFTTNYQPWANSQFVTTPEDTAIPLTLTGGDPEGQPITFAIVSQPEHGTLSVLNGAQITYTPDVGFAGTDFFQFDVFDGHFRSTPGLVFITVSPGARGMFVRSFNTGPGNSEGGQAIVTSADGSFVIGRNVQFILDDDIVVAKITATGARVWETRLQALGGQYIEELIQTSDGGYALLGGADDNPFLLFMAKLDSTGAIEWQKVMGADAGEDFLSGSIAEDGLGNLYVSSTVERNPDGDNDIWVAKLTLAGAFVWQKWLGVPGASEGEVSLAIVGGGPMILGNSNQGLVQSLVFHLDTDGQVTATRQIAFASSSILPASVVPVPGGGYVVVGRTSAGRPWLGRFNADHSVAWSREFVVPAGQFARIDNAVMRADGLMVISGALDEFAASPPRWAAGIDFSGNVTFQRRYDPAPFSRSVAAAASDGGFVLLGTRTGAFGDETILIKTDFFGQSGCDYGTSTALASGAPAVTVTTITGATTDSSATVVSSSLASRVAVTSNIVQICSVP